MDNINIDDIKNDFGEEDQFRDDHLMELLKKAYDGEIMCRMANVKISAIVPFAKNDEPVAEDFRKYFLKKEQEESYLPMLVYQKGDKFIMSDDYSSYAMYKELGYDIAPCSVIGDITDVTNIVNMGAPFRLKPPTAEIIN